jgi:hypothetical protein
MARNNWKGKLFRPKLNLIFKTKIWSNLHQHPELLRISSPILLIIFSDGWNLYLCVAMKRNSPINNRWDMLLCLSFMRISSYSQDPNHCRREPNFNPSIWIDRWFIRMCGFQSIQFLIHFNFLVWGRKNFLQFNSPLNDSI